MQQGTYISPRNVRALKLTADQVGDFEDLKRVGYCLDSKMVNKMMAAQGFDALESLVTTPSVTTPVQFLQNWLAGNVQVATAARKIDTLVGITVSGAWENEEIVQGLLELTGTSVPYGDYTNLPLSSWNLNFERRTVVRFEEGMRVGNLEEARAAAIRMNSAQSKRDAATLALDIRRNSVGFIGFNGGNNRTYGFLNDPSLPAYQAVAGGTWATKTYLEIVGDILTAVSALRTQSQDLIDPATMPVTLAVATTARDRLSTVSQYGNSVQDWISATYPKMRVESAPELDGADAGDNVFYLYAESISDNGSDDGATFIQVVPTRFIVTGVQKLAKGYEEGYSNATAGVMCKRPWAVYRASGI